MKYPDAPTLETDRLLLRAYRLADFEQFAQFYASQRSRFADGPVSRSTAWAWFAAGAWRWSLTGYGAWAVERREDRVCVGVVSLNHPIEIGYERELGWLLWERHEGNGYAVEAAHEARRFAFDQLGWASLVSYISTENDQSIRLAERIGAILDPAASTPDHEPTLVYRHYPGNAP